METRDPGSTTYFEKDIDFQIIKIDQNWHNYNYDGTELKLCI